MLWRVFHMAFALGRNTKLRLMSGCMEFHNHDMIMESSLSQAATFGPSGLWPVPFKWLNFPQPFRKVWQFGSILGNSSHQGDRKDSYSGPFDEESNAAAVGFEVTFEMIDTVVTAGMLRMTPKIQARHSEGWFGRKSAMKADNSGCLAKKAIQWERVFDWGNQGLKLTRERWRRGEEGCSDTMKEWIFHSYFLGKNFIVYISKKRSELRIIFQDLRKNRSSLYPKILGRKN